MAGPQTAEFWQAVLGDGQTLSFISAVTEGSALFYLKEKRKRNVHLLGTVGQLGVGGVAVSYCFCREPRLSSASESSPVACGGE